MAEGQVNVMAMFRGGLEGGLVIWAALPLGQPDYRPTYFRASRWAASPLLGAGRPFLLRRILSPRSSGMAGPEVDDGVEGTGLSWRLAGAPGGGGW